ncbi:MAG: TerC family protein [Pseudorhodoplanes sp.]|nr:TerC family protein [Pseudorhodoplanes sp.]
MLELLANPHAWAALVTLTVLEIVLGIDNLVFISVLVQRLEARAARRARQIGLSLALIFRILLLMLLTWIMGLREPLFAVMGHAVSWRDLILIAGGLFLIMKATREIHDEVEAGHDEQGPLKTADAFYWVVMQLIAIDLIFSLDSIITAIGMAQDIEVMVAAVIIAMIVMYGASGPVSSFIRTHPTTKMLALSFLLLIGVALVADGFAFHIPRGYIYFAMAFAAAVEAFNVIASRNRRRRRNAAGRP